ncbi:MAG: YkgJ family cysteine cluster protein [Hespellia sp.]|nr:YkgJ family cysteine cluster protein [Hespellia sp.]
MERDVKLEEISDGRLYTANDLVKADCGDCAGCSACCRGMGESIVLDPLDICRMTEGMGVSFEELLQKEIQLHVVDGVILPNLKMEDSCSFLSEEGRCNIHSFRPGICRLFPLGRFYEDGSFQYFLQVHECRKDNRTKVKVKKWIDTPNLKQYEAYICDWHFFLKDMQKVAESAEADMAKAVSLYVLQNFYVKPFGETHFYEEFQRRLETAQKQFLSQTGQME